jgi:Domain of unknown function (DUF4082)/Domain of unknown function (DUF1929)
MMTRVVSRSVPVRSFAVRRAVTLMFRNHVRLVVGALVMALIAVALSGPSRVQSVAAPAFLNTPVLQVTATTGTTISLSWTSVPDATEYQLERSESMSGPFNRRSIQTGTTFTDNTGSAQKAYLYRVRAIDSSVSPFELSQPSNMALGTTMVFEFSVLQGQTIRAQHIHDLRIAVNAVRRVATLPDVTFLPQNVTGLPVQAVDVQDLRNRLGEALLALNISIPPYTDPTLSTGANGTVIKGIHIEQLQARSTRGSSSSAGPLYLNVSKAVGGDFGEVISLPETPVHLSVLPDRRILFWSRDMLTNASNQVKQRAGSSDAYLWNTDNGVFTPVPNFITNLFCSGHSFLPNGDLFVTGGHRSAHFDAAGEAHTNIFNGSSWTQGPNMNNGRWYPYNVTLSTGEPLIMAGSYWTNEGTMGLDPYDPNDPVPPSPAPAFADNLVPEVYTPAQGGGLRPMPMPSPARLSPYPFLHLLSDGKVFQAQSGFTGSNPDKLSRLFDPKTKVWSSLPSTELPHATGSSVLLADDVVLMVGGFGNSSIPSNGVETINLLQPSPTWTIRESMKFPRTYHTATLLPDGKVLVTGGVSCQGRINIETFANGIPSCTSGEVFQPELWDPQTGKWTTMNRHAEVRAYHSVAALLPDGTVLVGGGGLPGAVGETTSSGKIMNVDHDHARLFGHSNVEIFSPPYLFDANGNPAARPTITSTPPVSVTYGETFFLGTSGAGSQPKVSFVRLPSVTHGTNQDQRLVSVDPVLTAGGINITVPVSSSKLPPGHYMVFVMNGSVPSEAAIIRVQNSFLFPGDTPTSSGSGAGQVGEQGVEFSSSVAGQITHIRFWKASGEPSSNHIGRIWTAGGTLLISVAFTNETASGWQEAILPTPLPITAHTKYRVSYNVQSTVALTPSVLTDPITSGPLVAWRALFSSTPGSFPTSVRTSNPFVEIRFK